VSAVAAPTATQVGALVDCSVKHRCAGLDDLLARMDEAWAEYFRSMMAFRMTTLADIEEAKLPPIEDSAEALATALVPTASGSVVLPVEGTAVSGWTEPHSAAAFVRAVNDEALDAVAAEGRSQLAIVVAPHDGSQAREEILRHADSKDVCGVLLPPLQATLSDFQYHEIYRTCEENELPVVIHPAAADGYLLGAPGFTGGVPPSTVVRAALRPAQAQAWLAALLLQGTLEAFPGLKLVFAGFGWRWVTPFLADLDDLWAHSETARQAQREPSRAALDQVRVVATGLTASGLDRRAWEIVLADGDPRLFLFGSGHPVGDASEALSFLEAIPAPGAALLAAGNATGFWGGRLKVSEGDDG
jgi:predicted TIM-barrel fold metal-dependent hydrolase